MSDTQTGLKVARAKALKLVAEKTVSDGFAFDLELLVRMKKSFGAIGQVPVKLNFKFESTINPKSYFVTLLEVFRVILLKKDL